MQVEWLVMYSPIERNLGEIQENRTQKANRGLNNMGMNFAPVGFLTYWS